MIEFWKHVEPGYKDALYQFDTATKKGLYFNPKLKTWVEADDFVNDIVTGWHRGGQRISQDQAEDLQQELSG